MHAFLIVAERRDDHAIIGYWSESRFFADSPDSNPTTYKQLSAARQAMTKLERGKWRSWLERHDARLRVFTAEKLGLALPLEEGAYGES